MKGNDNLKKYLKRTEGISSRRVLMTALMALAVLVIGAVLVAGVCLKEQALTTDFTRKNIAPCIQYPFGTDWMGRDMFVRTLTGLSLSIRIGLITSAFSSLIAVGMGLACRTGKSHSHCLQLPDRSGNGTCLCGRRKMGRQPDQWFY